jgi:hypothetical protein
MIRDGTSLIDQVASMPDRQKKIAAEISQN